MLRLGEFSGHLRGDVFLANKYTLVISNITTQHGMRHWRADETDTYICSGHKSDYPNYLECCRGAN